MRDFYSKRKDLILPCGSCPKKYPGCSDTCQDEEYLAVRQNLAKLKAYQQREVAKSSYEMAHKYRCEHSRKRHGKWEAM